jgi:transcriptional regulator with XRE-family HTH domain
MAEFDAPSARERQLAAELRLLRGTVGLHGKDVATRLAWSPSKVSRIETGRSGVSQDDLERMLTLYGVPEQRAEQLRRLAASAQSRGWWDAYAGSLSAGYSSLIKLESGSQALQCYCAVVPHALLQTPDYARQVIRSTSHRPSQTEIDRRVEVTRQRQRVLTHPDRPLRLSAVIDEAVFRRRVKDPDGAEDVAVTRAQFERLAEAATMPNVAIQVLPFEAGLPPVTGGSFSILESSATEVPDVVYLENKTRIFFVDSEAEVHQYTQDFAHLSALALSRDDSLAMIQRLATPG